MPELPEVELLSKYLNTYFKDKTLINFDFIKGKFNKTHPINFKEFQDMLPLKLTEINRKGKILILNFDNKWWLCIHFGLHGFLRTNNMIIENYDNNKKSINGIMTFTNDIKLNYVDTTGFGSSFKFFNKENDINKYLNKYAIDILNKDFTLDIFKENIKKIQNKNLKRNEIYCILLKQEKSSGICSGSGNYMACETLYLSEISPFQNINNLTTEDINKLYESIKIITDIHLKANGKSINHLNIYMKNKDNKGNIILKEKAPNGRTLYWVREIQK